jgi:hypothetical protein
VASHLQGECPWCVRVTCKHLNALGWPCQWSGYRPRGDAHKRCPWCGTTLGPFKVRPVSHRLSTICTFRRFARGSGPA